MRQPVNPSAFERRCIRDYPFPASRCPSGLFRRLPALVALGFASVGCDRPMAPQEPQSFVVVVVDAVTSTTRQDVAYDESGTDGYNCDDPEDCYDKCPDPQQVGGTTVCACLKLDDDTYWCDVTHYGPGEFPGGGGGCGGGRGRIGDGDTIFADCGSAECGDARDGLAEELATVEAYRGPRRPCQDFFEDWWLIKQDADTENGLHDGYGYIENALYSGLDRLSHAVGFPYLHVTSGYRCPRGDLAADGTGNGYHTYGRAADVYEYQIRVIENRYPTPEEFELLEELAQMEGAATLGGYSDWHLHVRW